MNWPLFRPPTETAIIAYFLSQSRRAGLTVSPKLAPAAGATSVSPPRCQQAELPSGRQNTTFH